MKNGRIKQLSAIDNPKFLYFIAGLLAITGLARIFGADGAGFLAGIFLGIIMSYILRVRIGGNVNED